LFSSLLGVCLAAPFGYIDEPSSPSTDVTSPGSEYLQKLKEIEPKFRQRLLSEVPEEGVNEYFELGFFYSPYNKAKYDSMVQWAKKWNSSSYV
ncbi:hypothetical protein PFISCL1PPCAC_7033, partial [Pristionchus fissidentatus]